MYSRWMRAGPNGVELVQREHGLACVLHMSFHSPSYCDHLSKSHLGPSDFREDTCAWVKRHPCRDESKPFVKSRLHLVLSPCYREQG
ncbi:uncharacterized protein ARMOST_02925 [Armillaria ostoyae]|uniref:Uncharacterized protein n=1 Tax=Armillaria ostoyae TaxID=47428 RepID=A0A284QT55_ARMOS|nr:uncharacterized protein ARMOST_02925 [Armillaria ostoyae]